MNRQEAIKRSPSKRESQLKNEKTVGEKVSVLTHGRPAVWVVSMNQYATQQQVDYGARGVETPTLWQYGNVATISTTLTAGVVDDE